MLVALPSGGVLQRSRRHALSAVPGRTGRTDRTGRTGRWPMHFRKTRAARRNPQDTPAPAPAPAGIQRLELLWWRFSAAEVQRLSLLQLVQRERPSARDLPLEEGRLRFALLPAATRPLSDQTQGRR